MATQADVMNYIKNNYQHDVIENGVLKFEFNIDDTRSQLVFALVLDNALVTWSPFASKESITAAQAFNATLDSYFGISILADSYCLKHHAPLENIDSNEIEVAFESLALAADAHEAELGLGDNL